MWLEFYLVFAMGKGKRTKGTKVALGDFIGESSGNTVNVGGKTVEMPSAPRASTLEIDVSKVFYGRHYFLYADISTTKKKRENIN